MSLYQNFPDLFSKRSSAFQADEDQEVEIAYLLQNAHPGDPRILELLVKRYGAEILRLTRAILGWKSENTSGAVLAVAGETFATATDNLHQIPAELSIRRWLFGINIRSARTFLRKQSSQARNLLFAEEATAVRTARPVPGDQANPGFLAEISRLKERDYLAVILRFLLGMNVPDTAYLVGGRESRLSVGLQLFRERFRRSSPGVSQNLQEAHPGFRRQIQAALDGYLDEGSPAGRSFRQHFEGCPECQAYAGQLLAVEAALRADLEQRWPLKGIEPVEIDRLVGISKQLLGEPSALRPRPLPIRQGMWITLISLMSIMAAWYLYQSGFDQGGPPATLTPAPTRLPAPTGVPAPIEITEYHLSQAEVEAPTLRPVIVYSAEPNIALDYPWVSFYASGLLLPDEQSDRLQDIFIYNPTTRTLERAAPVSGSTPDSARFSVSLSGDGRWVVFVSAEQESGIGGVSSEYSTGIYLHDRETGRTERIDRGIDGNPADGNSYAPLLSANGRWISFWSAAGNLVPGDEPACPVEISETPCIDGFVYDRETGVITRIPIGRKVQFLFSADRLSVSGDGSQVAVTVYGSDQIAVSLRLSSPLRAYLYSLESLEFVPLDEAPDGSAGDDISFAATLAADGRTAAFISRAGNLVPGDTNSVADIFVRDLESGAIEQASRPEGGLHGFEFAGRTFPENQGWGNLLNLSADGRFVAFLGSIELLAGSPSMECQTNYLGVCNAVFVYDRQTGKTQKVASPRADRIYLFPDISADGRWVTYLEALYNCDPATNQRVCSEVWLYDRQMDWTFAVTKGQYQLPDPLWKTELMFQPYREPVEGLAFAQQGEILATTLGDNELSLWDTSGEGKKGTLESSSGAEITSLASAPDGRMLAIGLSDGRVDIWLFPDQIMKYTLDGHPGRILQADFSSDGRRLVVRTRRGIRYWELRGEIFVLAGRLESPPGQVRGMALSPAGDYLATAESDETIWLRALPSMSTALRLSGHEQGMVSVAFSPSGEFLASAWQDGSIDLWRIESQASGPPKASYFRTLQAEEEIHSLAFSQDGNVMATVLTGGEIWLWRIPSGALIATSPISQEGATLKGEISFGPGGMAVGSTSGEIFIGLVPENVPAPRFFTRVDSDGFFPEGETPPSLRGEPGIGSALPGEVDVFENLYQANAAAVFEVKAPTFLPPGFTFEGAQVYPSGAVALDYKFYGTPGEAPTAGLSIFQQPVSPDLPLYTVGASALVESVRVAGGEAEYVRGEWRPFSNELDNHGQPTREVFWLWNAEAPAQRLRWLDEDQLFALRYIPYKTGGVEARYLTLADLSAIADSITGLGRKIRSNYTLTGTIYRDGANCLVAAESDAAGLTTQALAERVPPDGCQLVFADRNIQGLTLPFAEIDLDCDGRAERLQIAVKPGDARIPPSFWIVLSTLVPTGRFEEAWRYPVPDPELELSARVETITAGSCNRVLALTLQGEAGPDRRVFRWDGTTMNLAPAAEAANIPKSEP